MDSLILFYSRLIEHAIIPLIMLFFLFGLILLIKRHYLIQRENHFAHNIHEYAQNMAVVHMSGSASFYANLRHLLFRAMEESAHHILPHGHRLSWLWKKTKRQDWEQQMPELLGVIPPRLTSRIDKRIGIELLIHANEAERLLNKPSSQESMLNKITHFFDKAFGVMHGYRQLVSVLLENAGYLELHHERRPDFESMVAFSMLDNVTFRRIFPGISLETANSLLRSWHEIMIILGILGTFVGFFISFTDDSSVEIGIATAITSSIAGLTLGVIFLLLEKSFPDDDISENTLNLLEDTLDQVWNITILKDAKLKTA